MENIKPMSGNPKEENDLFRIEIIIEKEIMERWCQTTEEKTAWVEKHGKRFREIVQEPEIIELIKMDKNKAIEEIERRLKENF